MLYVFGLYDGGHASYTHTMAARRKPAGSIAARRREAPRPRGSAGQRKLVRREIIEKLKSKKKFGVHRPRPKI